MPNLKKIIGTTIVLGICFVALSGFRYQEEPYLVEVIVLKEEVGYCPTQVEVMEIWSDRSHVVRCLGVGERKNNKCAPSAHCTSNTINCSVIPSPVGGVSCDYCTSGTANNSFCWPVQGIVCSTDQSTYTCGTRMRSTCVVPGGGNPATCSAPGPTTVGTCTLEGCA